MGIRVVDKMGFSNSELWMKWDFLLDTEKQAVVDAAAFQIVSQ